jgi:hypothetical protein
VEDAALAVGQAFTQLGSPDVHRYAFGGINFRISRTFHCYRKEDPPSLVKPVSIIIIMFILQQANNPSSTQDHQDISYLITIAYYLLLRPGEHTGTPSEGTQFHLTDVELRVDDRAIDPWACAESNPHTVTFVSLTFTMQKNGTPCKVITHGLSTDDLA